MKLETVKSFILVVLIGISIILSYTLWSYQPNSKQIIGGEIADEEMNAGGQTDETKRSLTRPSDIIFHTGQGHYGFIDGTEQERLFEKIQEDWTITNFNDSTGSSIDRSSQAIEIVFAEEIPMRMLGSLLTFGQNDIVFPTWSMKRIVVSFIYESKSLQLEFISDNTNHRAVAIINEAEAYEYLLQMTEAPNENTMTEYLVVNEETPVYFPSGDVQLPVYSITPTDINPSLFVNILFSNPAVVRETSSLTFGVAYFTDNRQMNVSKDGMRMEYKSHVIPSADETGGSFSEIELLDHTIAHINGHGGWTYEKSLEQEYRLEDIDTEMNRVSFKMYYKGYPVFNNLGLDTIEQISGVNQNSVQLIEYNRPLFLFENEFIIRTIDLPTGEEIFSYLVTNRDISIENIQDVKIGYELKYEQDDQVIEMTPFWFKKESNVWQKLNLNETIQRGGN